MLKLIVLLWVFSLSRSQGDPICVCKNGTNFEETVQKQTFKQCCISCEKGYLSLNHINYLSNNSIVAICANRSELTSQVTLRKLVNVALAGYSTSIRTLVLCNGNNSGLLITESQNISLLNMELKSCGSQIIIMENHIHNRSIASLHIKDTLDVKIANVHVYHGQGKGISIINSYGIVEECEFRENKGNESVYGGGMYVEYNDKSRIPETALKNLTVRKCRFLSNKATFQKDKNSYAKCSNDTEFHGYNRGGGISIS